MILYLDTSALVKLYVREAGTGRVRKAADAAKALATSVVAYAEARAAFARLSRERRFRSPLHRRRVAALDGDWGHYQVVELVPTVARTAGDLAESHSLRGFDAIHLASALWLQSAYSGEVRFLAFDTRLAAAAVAAGLSSP